MADEVFSVGFKVDSSGVEGDAEAAGKAAAAAFKQGFGTVDLAGALRGGGPGGAGGGGGAGGVGASIAKQVHDAVRDAQGRFAARAEPTRPEDDPLQRIPKTAEVAMRSIESLHKGLEGLAAILGGASFAEGAEKIKDFAASMTGVARASGLLRPSLEDSLPIIGGFGAALTAGATAAYDMTRRAESARVSTENMAKASGQSTESFVKFRDQLKGSGVDLDAFERATTAISVRMQALRSQIAQRVAEEPLETADDIDRIADATRAHAASIDAVGTARDKMMTARARWAVQAQFGAQEDVVTRAERPITRAGAEEGAEQAEINAIRARLRARQIIGGQAPDFRTMESLEKRQARLDVEKADTAEQEAQLNLRRVNLRLAEQEKAEGLGTGPGGVGTLPAARQQEEFRRQVDQARRDVEAAREAIPATGRQIERARIEAGRRPEQQITAAAQTILTGQGVDLSVVPPDILFGAVVRAGQLTYGNTDPLATVKAYADFVRRDPKATALLPLMREMYRTLPPEQRQALTTRLGELGGAGIAAGQAAPLTPDQQAATSLKLLAQGLEAQRQEADRRTIQEQADREVAEKAAPAVGAATGVFNQVLQSLGGGGQVAVDMLAAAGVATGLGYAGRGALRFMRSLRPGAAAPGGVVPTGAQAPAPTTETAPGGPGGGGFFGEIGGVLGGLFLAGPTALGFGEASGAANIREIQRRAAAERGEGPLTTADLATMLTQAGRPTPAPDKPVPVQVVGPGGALQPPAAEREAEKAPAAPAAPAAAAGEGLTGAASALGSAASALSAAAGALTAAAGAIGGAGHEGDGGGDGGEGGGGGRAAAGGGGGGGGGEEAGTPIEQAAGGLISGSGDGTSDSIPIMASNGEYIIRQSRVQQLGTSFLDRINSGYRFGGLVGRFQEGGQVGAVPDWAHALDDPGDQREPLKPGLWYRTTGPSGRRVMQLDPNGEEVLRERSGQIVRMKIVDFPAGGGGGGGGGFGQPGGTSGPPGHYVSAGGQGYRIERGAIYMDPSAAGPTPPAPKAEPTPPAPKAEPTPSGLIAGAPVIPPLGGHVGLDAPSFPSGVKGGPPANLPEPSQTKGDFLDQGAGGPAYGVGIVTEAQLEQQMKGTKLPQLDKPKTEPTEERRSEALAMLKGLLNARAQAEAATPPAPKGEATPRVPAQAEAGGGGGGAEGGQGPGQGPGKGPGRGPGHGPGPGGLGIPHPSEIHHHLTVSAPPRRRPAPVTATPAELPPTQEPSERGQRLLSIPGRRSVFDFPSSEEQRRFGGLIGFQGGGSLAGEQLKETGEIGAIWGGSLAAIQLLAHWLRGPALETGTQRAMRLMRIGEDGVEAVSKALGLSDPPSVELTAEERIARLSETLRSRPLWSLADSLAGAGSKLLPLARMLASGPAVFAEAMTWSTPTQAAESEASVIKKAATDPRSSRWSETATSAPPIAAAEVAAKPPAPPPLVLPSLSVGETDETSPTAAAPAGPTDTGATPKGSVDVYRGEKGALGFKKRRYDVGATPPGVVNVERGEQDAVGFKEQQYHPGALTPKGSVDVYRGEKEALGFKPRRYDVGEPTKPGVVSVYRGEQGAIGFKRQDYQVPQDAGPSGGKGLEVPFESLPLYDDRTGEAMPVRGAVRPQRRPARTRGGGDDGFWDAGGGGRGDFGELSPRSAERRGIAHAPRGQWDPFYSPMPGATAGQRRGLRRIQRGDDNFAFGGLLHLAGGGETAEEAAELALHWRVGSASTAAAATSLGESAPEVGRDVTEAALSQVRMLSGPLNVGANVSIGSEVGNREVMSDPAVQRRLEESDVQKSRNIASMGMLRGSWQNLKESFSQWPRVRGGLPGAESRRLQIDLGRARERRIMGFAGGGLVPAMVSNGEYRMSADAVRRYGVGFMDALNGKRLQGGGPIGAPTDYIPPLSQYGLEQQEAGSIGAAQVLAAAAAGPGFADQYSFGGAGLTRGLSPFAGLGAGLSTSLPPGLPSGGAVEQHALDLITNAGQFQVSATADTIEAMRASAIGAKLTSTGTRPSWY